MSKRILAPIAAACITVFGVMAYLWWQLPRGTVNVQQHLAQALPNFPTFTNQLQPLSAADSRDEALLHLRKGDLLAARGQWTLAAEEYQQSVDQDGGLPALRKLAQAQLQKRDVNGAKLTAEAMRREGAKQEDLTLLNSIILLRTGEVQQAQTMLDAAPDSPQKAYGLALLGIIREQHDMAKQQLDIVIAGWEPVLRSYARTLKAAYDEYALFPDSPAIHVLALLGRSLAQVQECELALPLLSRVTQQQSDYRDAWIVQGYCELNTERFREALASLERAYQIDPEKPETQYFLARAYIGVGDHGNALTFLQYALQNGFTPEAEVRMSLAQEAVQTGNLTLALEQLDQLTLLQDATPEAFALFVTVSISSNQAKAAYQKALQGTTKWPGDASMQVQLGKAALATNRRDEADAAAKKALEIDPNNEEAKQFMNDL